MLLKLFSSPALSESEERSALKKLQAAASMHGLEAASLQTEFCYYIETKEALSKEQSDHLFWLLRESEQGAFGESSTLGGQGVIIEVGPRLNVTTAYSTNATAICQSVGLATVTRIERSRRFHVVLSKEASESAVQAMAAVLFDRMTECRYLTPLSTFDIDIHPDPVFEVDIMARGKQALKETSDKLGLAFDDWDLEYYTGMFRDKMKRNPTSVECFDLAQSNSEHSRHWFFTGRLEIDGEEIPASLMKMVKSTQTRTQPNNSVIAFHDNSSAIKGFEIDVLAPEHPARPSAHVVTKGVTRHAILTAETHNFPTGVAPFQGATTGTGGRIRDVQATGRGANVIAGTVGYCVGNLQIPGYPLPWEDAALPYPANLASPLEIEIEASNGASDYGNKFGEPAILGFTRSFGMVLPGGERREWIKPIMFSGGIGTMDARHTDKLAPDTNMLVVKIGGPAYRVGMGGGAASSVMVQGGDARDADLDFSAVQRGDAEMEQKMNRAIRACVEMGDTNPICSIHDQGAGGNGNVLKEIVDPKGAEYHISSFAIGDPTLSALELWGAEYQENNAALVREDCRELLQEICDREKVPVSFVGQVTGNGRIALVDDRDKEHVTRPYDLELELVLGKLPQKIFKSKREARPLQSLALPAGTTVEQALDRVLRLLSVGSKRFLTNKVDRSVTGLIAQQQCVGPLHTPLANVSVTAMSPFNTVGIAASIGEQPIKMLIDNEAGARMAIGEAVTNLVWAPVTALRDTKCSGNWMWAAKLPGEGAALHDACKAMCDTMVALGMALDGGKDSLSMAAKVKGETVKAPGELVISLYCTCPDITNLVTPDLKGGDGVDPVASDTVLLLVDLAPGKARLGGSALAQVYGQLGSDVPDLEDTTLLDRAFAVTQGLIAKKVILAGHDRSDGGLITAALEMAFAGNCGLNLQIAAPAAPAMDTLFAEELGLLLQVRRADVDAVVQAYEAERVPVAVVGQPLAGAGPESEVRVAVGGEVVLSRKMAELRDIWEATSFQLERLQCNPKCVEMEEAGMKARRTPPWKLSFTPSAPQLPREIAPHAPRVATVREEGSNGDREMVVALHLAGFDVWDVTMSDICSGKVALDMFKGLVFVGGFSYADVCGSAKGWAGTALFNTRAREELERFRQRKDAFSLGICNGCQLMGLLGWVGMASHDSDKRSSGASIPYAPARFTHNASGRFESRFTTVKVQPSPAVLLKGMEGSVLGIWVAHGEGRVEFKEDSQLACIERENLAPIRYVDDDGEATEVYPFNPNGSPAGIASLCSPCGRHLAIMPHPERCVLKWQFPWLPESWRSTLPGSPWMRMFENAYAFAAL